MLLFCATAPPGDAYRAWLELNQAGLLCDLDHRAARMLPAIGRNLSEYGSFPGQSLCAAASERARDRNLSLREGCKEALDLLETRGRLQVILLKGIYLNEALYKNLGMRYSSDFDLLVRFEQAEHACSLLEADGWERTASIQPKSRLEHGVDFTKGPWRLDLHWFLLREARNPGQDDPYWAHRQRVDLELFSADVLCPTHQLFHLVTLATREPHTTIRYLLDIKHLYDGWRDEIDWVELERLLKERHLLTRWATLPLELVGLGRLRPDGKPTLVDWLWSHSSGTRFDGSAEFYYSFFPILDYWFHFRGDSFFAYMRARLDVHSLVELINRMVGKISRLVKDLLSAPGTRT